MVFYVFRAFNTAGKSVSKIGIYSKPPPKSDFYSDFIIYRPILAPEPFFIKIIINKLGLKFITGHWNGIGFPFETVLNLLAI
jgi:hypothetical protein